MKWRALASAWTAAICRTLRRGRDEIVDLIRASDTVLWLTSASSVKSRWCKWELGEAQRLHKRIIAISLENVPSDNLPESVERTHLLPAEGVFDFKRHLAPLLETIETDGTWLRGHTRFAEIAHQWLARECPQALLLRRAALAEAQSLLDRRPLNVPSVSHEVLQLLLASYRAQHPRQRTAMAAGLVVGAMGVLLAGVGAWQGAVAIEKRAFASQLEFHAAEEQEFAESRVAAQKKGTEAAQKNFETARKTIDGLVNAITQNIGGAEGGQLASARETLALVETTIGQFSETAPHDTALQQVRAQMFAKSRRGISKRR